MAKIAVLGAGMMGSALCVPLVDAGNEVHLVGTHLDREIIENLQNDSKHPRLNDCLPQTITPLQIERLADALQGAEVVALGVSSAGIPWAIEQLKRHRQAGRPILMITKGLSFDGEQLMNFPDQVGTALSPSAGSPVYPVAVAGPCIAGELARRVPTCVVFTGRDTTVCEQLARLARTSYYHVWISDDLAGVELCAALKNAYAMAVAFAAGLHEGGGGQPGSVAMHNYESAVFAQAVWEMAQLVQLIGGQLRSTRWLPGVGDLDVTNNGGRTGRFGRLLGRGLSVAEAVKHMQGATLECLEIIAVVRRALEVFYQSGRLSKGQLPLFEHMAAVVDGAPIAVPFSEFFSNGPVQAAHTGRPEEGS